MADIDTYKKVLASIKDRYPDKESSFEFYARHHDRPELGIVDIDVRGKKLNLRNERHASAAVYSNLIVIDYGDSNRKMDPVSMIRDNTNLSFEAAIELLCEWEKQPLDPNFQYEPKPIVIEEKKKVAPYAPKYIERKLLARKEGWDIFKELRDGLLRGCSMAEKKQAINLFEIGLDSYETDDNKVEHRLFIPEYDQNKVPYGSFRYNRNLDPKGLLRSNCQRVLFGSHLLNKFDLKKPFIFDEGHSDTIVNVAKGYQALTTGSSTTKIGPFLPLLEGLEIHFFPDCDEPGIHGVTSKILEIMQYNKTARRPIKYKVFWWSAKFIERKIADTNWKKIDVFDEKELKALKKTWWWDFKDEIGEDGIVTIDVLKKHQQEMVSTFIAKNQTYIPQENKVTLEEINDDFFIDKWTLLSRDTVKQGFDFIDFHVKYNKSANYLPFLEKYKFPLL